MIIRRLERGSSLRGGAAERSYMRAVSSYIVRARSEDLKWLIDNTNDPYLQDLSNYIARFGALDHVAHSGAIGLHGETLEEWQAELHALLHNCPNSEGAVSHWVLSWPEGERPSPEQLRDCFETFQHVMGGGKHFPIVYGAHDDTENRHAHGQVVSIDIETGRKIELGRGWSRDTAMRVKAVLESRHGWQAEPNSPYRVVDGLLIHNQSGRSVGPANDPARWEAPPRAADSDRRTSNALSQKSREWEEETGFMSRERIAAEIAGPLLLKARSFADAHRCLAKEGIELCRKGTNGAVLKIGGKVVRNTRENRLSALQKRFGKEFEERPADCLIVDRWPRSLWSGNVAMETYYAVRRAHAAEIATVIPTIKEAMRLGGASSEVVAEVVSTLKTELTFPTAELYAAGERAPPAAELAWRRAAVSALGPGGDRRDTTGATARHRYPSSIGPFTRYPGRKGAAVYRRDGAMGRPALVAMRDVVMVNQLDVETVRSALLLLAGSDRKGSVRILSGDKAFRDLVAAVAAQEKIVVESGRNTRRPAIDRAPVSRNATGIAQSSAEDLPELPAGPSQPSHGPAIQMWLDAIAKKTSLQDRAEAARLALAEIGAGRERLRLSDELQRRLREEAAVSRIQPRPPFDHSFGF